MIGTNTPPALRLTMLGAAAVLARSAARATPAQRRTRSSAAVARLARSTQRTSRISSHRADQHGASPRAVPSPAARSQRHRRHVPSSPQLRSPQPPAAPALAPQPRPAAARRASRRSPRRARRSAAASRSVERRFGAGRRRLHERAEVGFGRRRDQELRRGDRRDAEEPRQRLLFPRHRQVRQERLRRRDRRLRPGAAARSRRTPIISTAAPPPTRPRTISTSALADYNAAIKANPNRSTPTTTAAPPISARATTPAPPPTTAR